MHPTTAAVAAAQAACLAARLAGNPLAQFRARIDLARALGARAVAADEAWATADPHGYAAYLDAQAAAGDYYETAQS